MKTKIKTENIRATIVMRPVLRSVCESAMAELQFAGVLRVYKREGSR